MIAPREIIAIAFPAAWIGFGVGVGVGVGTIFFAFANNLKPTYDNIGRFDSAGLSLLLRLSFTVVVAIILCVLIKANVVALSIGEIQFAKFEANSLTCFVIGAFVASTDMVAAKVIIDAFNGARTDAK